MLTYARNLLNRFRKRSYEGASGKRFENWRQSTFGAFNSEVNAAAPAVRGRARHFAENNAHAANGVAAWVTALVGAGITPASQHPNRDTRRAIAAAFRRWAARCDADGRTDFYGLQAQAVRGMIIDGESFLQLIQTEDGLKLRLIAPELIDSSHTVELGDGRRIIAGIEFDASERVVAYWVRPARATDLFPTYGNPVRVPAEDMIHLFVSHGQVRGMSWLAPVLLRLGELDQLEDALLVGVKVAAMRAGFLTDMNGTGTIPFDGTQAGNILTDGLEPGTLRVLPNGYDIKFSSPQQAQQSIEFVQHQLRAIAAGLGVPAHLLDGDLRQANYSSLRAALVSFRQRVEQIQFHTLIPQLLTPIWDRFIMSAVLSGELEFDADVMAAEWYPPAMPWVDPAKDAQAEAELINAGLKSRRQAVSERGFDIESLDDEISADRKREQTLGLSFGVKQNAGA